MNRRMELMADYLTASGMAKRVGMERRIQLAEGVQAKELKIKEPIVETESMSFMNMNVRVTVKLESI